MPALTLLILLSCFLACTPSGTPHSPNTAVTPSNAQSDLLKSINTLEQQTMAMVSDLDHQISTLKDTHQLEAQSCTSSLATLDTSREGLLTQMNSVAEHWDQQKILLMEQIQPGYRAAHQPYQQASKRLKSEHEASLATLKTARENEEKAIHEKYDTQRKTINDTFDTKQDAATHAFKVAVDALKYATDK